MGLGCHAGVTQHASTSATLSNAHLHLTKNAEELRSVCNREVWRAGRRRYPYYLVKGGTEQILFECLSVHYCRPVSACPAAIKPPFG
ncbi:hypothetical protein MTP99_013601 [Tenebrio molitor]|jgi:hypothetical protein|nr:hypothetical protein MTP99_013601 [Tenebrio molitor]